MSIFNFFRRAAPVEMLHPLFGRIVYQGDETWELGKVSFPPVGHVVEVIIHAGVDGPSEAHGRFWKEMIERWPEILRACEPILRRALVDWVEGVETGDIWSRVDVESLSIYAGQPPDEWELMFWCEDAGHWPTVSMKGWNPTDCFVDG